MEAFEERAWDLENTPSPEHLSQPMPVSRGENPMVRHNQLSEWQKNSLPRPPHLYTADTVPNSAKLDIKWRFWRVAEEADVSKSCVIAELGSSRPWQRLRT
jgi:hypothetical protein